MIKFSAFADEVDSNFRNQIGFLVKHKVEAIEIRFVNRKNIMDLDRPELIETKNILHDHQIDVSAIGSPIGKVTISDTFDDHFDKFKKAVDLAAFFRTTYIRVFSYYAPGEADIESYREEVIDRMAKKADYLKGSEIVMVHENESGIYGHNAENCVDLVKTVNSPHLRLAYDPANFVWGEKITDNVSRCWPLMQPYVVHVHIKDWKLGSKDVGIMPGQGDGQINALLIQLAGMNYNGYLTMEPHLRSGGQFGGDTGPNLFAEAIKTTRHLCDSAGLMHT